MSLTKLINPLPIRAIAKPTIAQVKYFFACVTRSSIPPAVIKRIPDQIIIITATGITKLSKKFIMLAANPPQLVGPAAGNWAKEIKGNPNKIKKAYK